MDGEEALLLKVDIFLAELERRLEFIENYSDLTKDIGVSWDFSTLQAVRTRCRQASGEVIDAGWNRLHAMVETLEKRSQETLEAAETLNDKAHAGIELLEDMLSEFEAKAYRLRAQGFSRAANAAEAFMGEGRRVAYKNIGRVKFVMDESYQRARRATFSLEEHIQQAITKAKKTRLLRYDDLPIPWRSNPHIHRGYRFSETKMGCVRSIFLPSNESVNIWTHAIGLIIVLSIAFKIYPSTANFALSSKTDILVAAIFFIMACVTLACSATWHTMNAMADFKAVSTFACVDYTGISLLIAASIMTVEYTAFYCDPVSRWLYMSTTAILGVCSVFMGWHPKFDGPDKAWTRVLAYVALALTGFTPMIQLLFTHGAEFTYAFYSPLSRSMLAYFGGAIIYANKIPERWYPGMFDYVGGSHNLWHGAVLGGILFHYIAMQSFFANAFMRAEAGCPAY